MTQLTVEDIVENIFTTPNPETGSQPPENIAWVLFENDTIYLAIPSELTPLGSDFEQLAKVARQELKSLGVAAGGTSSADFSVNKVSWYPNDYIFMVTYDHGHIFNISIQENETNDVSIGVLSRSARSLDAEELKVKKVRDFNKVIKEMK